MEYSIRPIRLGSLRYKDESGEWIVAEPDSSYYSTVTMLASECLTEQGWKQIQEYEGAVHAR